MKILHISDVHLGQVLYQHYERQDEHDHFFTQLQSWCRDEAPDALLVTGDIFDIQQPSASTWERFNHHFLRLRAEAPRMKIVIVAGNHDSPSRLHSHRRLWEELGTTLVALPPRIPEAAAGWEEEYVVKIDAGYIVALPYMAVCREEVIQHLLDYVAERNAEGLPVVMTAHLAVSGCDATGHDFDIGHLRTVELPRMGSGYDYLALGHIHKPQTLDHGADAYQMATAYQAPVARYAGSVLHVSCDEAYPHSASVVEIDRHGGSVGIRQLRIDQLRHFITLPSGADCYSTAEEALKGVEKFRDDYAAASGTAAASDTSGKCAASDTAATSAASAAGCYIRLRISKEAATPSDFQQQVYALLQGYESTIRYNPKIEWAGAEEEATQTADAQPRFQVAELQQMLDPLDFIERTADRYPGLDIDALREAFEEIRREVRDMEEETANPKKRKQ